jgi:prepilin-type N-terminal cleavage/methylation domain-containing protein
MLKPKLPKKEQGFTLVEVLVAILIATIFITVTMQMMVIATVFKVKAQENTEATNWIQGDLENVRYQADKLQFQQTKLAADAVPPSSPALVSPISINTPSQVVVDSFAVGDKLRVGLDPTNYTITVVSGTGITSTSTRTLTISPALEKAQAANALVVATKRCTPGTDQNKGLADWLRDNVTDTNPSDGITDITSNVNTLEQQRTGRNNKNFKVSRITTLSATSPYNVLEVFYSVAPTTAHTTLSADALATSTTLSVASASGFKVGDKLTVGTKINNTIASISGTTITLSSALGSAQTSGSIVDVSVATANTEVIPNVAFQCP